MFKNHKVAGALLLGLMLMPLFAQSAEMPKNLQPLEEIPPPKLSTEADPDEPEITIVKKGNGETVEEYRMNGEFWAVITFTIC